MDQVYSTKLSRLPRDGAVLSTLATSGGAAPCQSRELGDKIAHWTGWAFLNAGPKILRADHTRCLDPVYRPVFGCIICQLWVLSFNWSITVVKMLAQLSSCVYVSFWLENIFMS